jgi:hypothetical protein
MGEGCNQTDAIAEQLQLEFELLPNLQGSACPAGTQDELTVERINNAGCVRCHAAPTDGSLPACCGGGGVVHDRPTDGLAGWLAGGALVGSGIWFGGGLPGRTVSCMYGFSAEAFGINSNPEAMASPVLRALWCVSGAPVRVTRCL